MNNTPRLALAAVAAMLLAACSINVYEEGSLAGGQAPDGAPGGGTEGGGANQEANTGEVSISGANVDPEAGAIQGVIDEFVNGTSDFTATYSGSDSFEQNVIIQIQGGTPPDIGWFPQPGAVVEQAEQGNLVALEDLGFDIAELEERFGSYLLSLGEYDGKYYGFPMDVNYKSAVWYPLQVFEENGYEPATTWEELIALSDQMIADGYTPWCIGTSSDANTGWPATDWMEDIVLRSGGTDVYDQWVTHDIDFASEEVTTAAEYFGEILFTDGYVFGGHEAITGTDFRDAPDPMFNDPPNCLMHRQATFITNFFPEDQGLEAGVDYSFFKFPTIDGNDGVLMAGGMAAVFRNSPEVAEFLDKWSSDEAQCSIGSYEGVALISPNVNVGEDCYRDEIISQAAGDLSTALQDGTARFDASDLMPPEVGSGSFWTGMNDYTNDGPDNLQAVLEGIDSSWPS